LTAFLVTKPFALIDSQRPRTELVWPPKGDTGTEAAA